MTASIADQLDQMLKDDKTFSTRSGLRFMAELVRDAFEYIEKGKEQNKDEDDRLKRLEDRVNEIDKSLTTFLQTRSREQEQAEEARLRWRLATIAPIIVLVFTEILRLILGK